MNSIGGFREGEIDGKPFHIFTLLSHKDNHSSSSSSSFSDESPTIDSSIPFQPLFFCPSIRLTLDDYSREEIDYLDEFPAFKTPPHFSIIRSQEVPSDTDDFCTSKLPVVPLFWCNTEEPSYNGFCCHACANDNLGTGYYLCVTCNGMFHKECVESPLEIKHPSCPFQSLQLCTTKGEGNFGQSECNCCETGLFKFIYHCPAYKLSLHPVCAMKPKPIDIDQPLTFFPKQLSFPKCHPHPLTFFPKQAFLPCDVCGLIIQESMPIYVCVSCVFVVHRDCIYFPRVIKISRHHHRIALTYSLPSGKWSCGVCRQKVDDQYGAYSCTKCSDYFVHSRCAIRRDLWDGEELEGVPEEPEIVVEPFERIAEGIILHFSHGHHMKLKISKVYDEDIFCQACILPIYEDGYYSCMDQCDFILHETCANAPLKKSHALHAHSVSLKVVTSYKTCRACLRNTCGFIYHNSIGKWGQTLDLRCALVSEPFEYESHKHPLFLTLTPEEERLALCHICQGKGAKNHFGRKLNCIECSFILCFACATLPYKARYKHDKHLLTFREKEEASSDDHRGWCDKCEGKIVYSRKGGFYSCDDYCSTTLHVDCLLGREPYMKPGHIIKLHRDEFHISRNNTMSRPFCHVHEDRCRDKVVFKKENLTFCSSECSLDFLGFDKGAQNLLLCVKFMT